jgi:hypothetical protein
MGFRDVRCLLIDALESGRYQHEFRADMESKNLLAVGEVSPEFVVRLLQRCPGKRYRASRTTSIGASSVTSSCRSSMARAGT